MGLEPSQTAAFAVQMHAWGSPEVVFNVTQSPANAQVQTDKNSFFFPAKVGGSWLLSGDQRVGSVDRAGRAANQGQSRAATGRHQRRRPAAGG